MCKEKCANGGSVKEITKFEKTSLSDFSPRKAGLSPQIVCASEAGMFAMQVCVCTATRTLYYAQKVVQK